MKREALSDKVFVVLNGVFLFGMTAIVLYPLIYIMSASISDPTFVNSGQMWLFPKGITFEGFERVFQNAEIWLGYRNTIFYTVLGVLISLAVMLPCAYALSRSDMKGRYIISLAFIFTMLFQGGLIPTYLLVRDLGMVNSIWSQVIPNAANAWAIMVMRTFFQNTIPRELEEAAEIDGCSTIALFFKIVIPLSAPLIAVMALFNGVGHWNAYFNAMIYLSDRELFPLQLFLREILIMNEMSATMMMDGADLESMAIQAEIADIVKYAVMIVSSLPLLIVYPFLQRYFVKGVMIGSLKG
jgi:putative aldouronate transport system permease protein